VEALSLIDLTYLEGSIGLLLIAVTYCEELLWASISIASLRDGSFVPWLLHNGP